MSLGLVIGLVASFLSYFAVAAAPASAATGSSCGANINPIACENTLPGTPASVWDISGAGDPTIQGFSTNISVNAGSPISFKIKTSTQYTLDIYRLGYYGGDGAALKVSNLSHVAPVTQPTCLSDTSTGLYDCGNWSVSATWNVPSTAVSGVYIAKLTKTDGSGGASHITFIVRNDTSSADIVYQTSDETWQAYNRYGGADFYTGSTVDMWDSKSRARKISYNRPFATRGDSSGRDFLFSNEYPTIRYLEQNGYDVTYIAGVDTDRYGATLLKNHKVFLSVGHDEYWSQAQRNNVQAARDAGVNLMFLSGNEMYWHTRFEASIDGSNTAYRTLVCYKTTWDNANTDPTGENTSTWRDPRFASTTAPNVPENNLTGTMYMSNTSDFPVTVTQAEGKTRLWRNTGLSGMSGSSTALAPHTVGYESDEDIDNGFRPAGLVDLTSTTGQVTQELQDFGNVVVPGTHHNSATLYRAASGALVFSAGTIQWGWGLDPNHDGDTSGGADTRMRQATMNMLADMGAQPTTRASDLVAATASTDTTPPTVAITSPASNATVANGTMLNVTGTASDVGGVVAGVEVSVDGGASWHPATGTTNWTYSAPLHGNGPVTIKVRATDDSANTSSGNTSVTINSTCPCSVFGNLTPKTPDSGDSYAFSLGLRFTTSVNGTINGIRFYKSAANTGTHTGTLWTASGTQLAKGTFTNETASGWQTLTFATPVQVTAGTTYVASYYAPNGHYSKDIDFFYYRDYAAPPLNAESNNPNDVSKMNGVYNYGGDKFTPYTDQGDNYYVDVNFSPGAGASTPAVSSTTPASGASNVAVAAQPAATFNKAMNASSLTFTLKDSGGVSVAGSAAYNSGTNTYTFTPSATLANNTTYTAAVNGSDATGVALAAPYTWTFTTVASGTGSGPVVASTTPAAGATNVATSVSPTVTFTNTVNPSTLALTVTDNGGSQVPGTVSYNPTLLTATFNPSTALSAGKTYVGSVSVSDATGQAMATPYTWSFSTVPGSGITGPTAASVTPLDTATSVPVTVTPQAVLTEAIVPSSLSFTLKDAGGNAVPGTASYDSATNTATFTPSASLTRGVKYTAAVSATDTTGQSSSAPYTWSFTTAQPSPTPGVCPCSVWDDSTQPDTADVNDPHSVEVGMQFSSDTAGQITGVRFYKGPQNTGVHTGSLYAMDGTLLATATFSNESASGWQTVKFGTPVTVTANTSYLVSYHTNVGYYAETYGGTVAYNGLDNPPLHVPAHAFFYLYGSGFPTGTSNSNYWVDPIFTSSGGSTGDTTPPTVTTTTPANSATSVATTTTATATFSEAINAATLTMTAKDAANNPVPGAVSYDAPSQTATFTPTAALANNTQYTVSVSASDVAGNAMPAPATFSFTTIASGTGNSSCPCSMWNEAALPDTASSSDGHSVELGVQFSADRAGYISGIRFYKGSKNTGTHTGSLWSSSGTLLATATFTGESATGWQQVNFATPVAVTANTTYIASYLAPSGGYAETYGGTFATAGADNSPLHMPAHPGLYVYGSGGVVPNGTSNSNYWVDPVFVDTVTGPPADTTPPVISAVAAAGSGTTATISWNTDEAATSTVNYGISASALTSTATTSGLGTTHSVALNGLTAGATYYYQVVSADAAGNTATSSTASFSPKDVTPPVVTGLTATGSGTSATVTWATDEPATSTVNYGTSATALTSTATVAGLVTSHSVPLTGLAANTRYYYQVVSADAAGNSTTAPSGNPASYAPSVAPLTDSTFAGGTVASTYVAANGAGEVVLNPSAVQEFTATSLPTPWKATAVVTGGKVTFPGGTAVVSGANFTTTTTFGNNTSWQAQLTMDKNQSFGLVTSSNANVKLSLSVNASGQLVAAVNDGVFNNASSVIQSGWTAAPHVFRIDFTSSAATFFLDGVQKYTHAFRTWYGSTYRPNFGDTSTTDASLSVDWIRQGPFAASGTFTSKVLDAGAGVNWGALSWDADVPAGTTLTVKVRTGNTATPDASWSAYTTISASGGSVGRTSRYLQYQLSLTTSGTRFVTPVVRSVTAAFGI